MGQPSGLRPDKGEELLMESKATSNNKNERLNLQRVEDRGSELGLGLRVGLKIVYPLGAKSTLPAIMLTDEISGQPVWDATEQLGSDLVFLRTALHEMHRNLKRAIQEHYYGQAQLLEGEVAYLPRFRTKLA